MVETIVQSMKSKHFVIYISLGSSSLRGEWPRGHKPYFPAPGPFKIGRGRVKNASGVFVASNSHMGMGKTLCINDQIQTFRDLYSFEKFVCQPFGDGISKNAPKTEILPKVLLNRSHQPKFDAATHLPILVLHVQPMGNTLRIHTNTSFHMFLVLLSLKVGRL